MTNGRLNGKVALVTGAARGLGRACAVRMAKEGADLLIADICADFPETPYAGATTEDLDETAKLVAETGRRVASRVVDVREMDPLQAFVDEGVAELGRLDIVIANAGVSLAARSWELTSEEFDAVLSVNLKGTWQTTKAAIPTMIEQGEGGAIIMIGSTGAVKGLPFLAHYSAAKHGVVGLAKSLAVELGQHAIRSVVIHPAAMPTGMVIEPMFALIGEHPETASVFQNTLPAEMLDPEDVASMAAFLVSDEARNITGSEFRVDIGNLCR
nr:mycofactocin-coupled SDR family oxidoreductase [Rhodococcus wratislaviensis]GLK33167.1 3-ketoacyl-ACP reductase [Rhodococcus wratislaviensis]